MQIKGYNRSTILKYTGRYVCKASFVSSGTNNVEKDDSFSSANPVVFGRTMVGQISMNDDYDMYRFTLSKIGCVTLDMTSYMPYYCIRISDANGKEIWYVDRNKWNGDVGYRRDTYNLYLEKGTYYMQVNAYIYATVSGYTGRYVLNAKYTPSKVSFEGDDDSFATAKSISSDVKYTGQMSLGEDWDTYKFVMLSGKEVEVNMASYMRYYCIRIFDSNGKEVWYTDKNEWNSDVGYRKDIHKIKLSTGTYYMQVNGYSSYGVTPYRDQATGKYVFSVNGICNHKYKSTTTKAGVSTNGSITKTCSKCGKKTKTVIYAAKYIKLSKALFTYDGKTHKPTVTLVDSKGKKLKSGTDYTLKYSGDCKNVGKYKVTAVFKGNYKGTHSSTITIRPKGLGISKLIPASRDFRVNWKKQTVQTKGYELQYSTTSKFSKKDTKSVMLKNTTTSKKVTGVQPNKKYYVRIRSYKEVTVNGKKEKIYSAWSGTKWVQTKP